MSRILIVEDYPPLATVLAIGVKRLGHTADRVRNVAGGLSLARQALVAEVPYALAILDVDLPDGNGPDLAAVLRAEGLVGQVIFHTATRERALREEAARFGPVLDKRDGVPVLLHNIAERLPSGPTSMVPAPGGPDARAADAGAAGERDRARQRVAVVGGPTVDVAVEVPGRFRSGTMRRVR